MYWYFVPSKGPKLNVMYSLAHINISQTAGLKFKLP